MGSYLGPGVITKTLMKRKQEHENEKERLVTSSKDGTRNRE